jgi:SET domain-containing protein
MLRHLPTPGDHFANLPSIPGLKVTRSSIDGYGLVATREFHPGEELTTLDGVVWRRGEAVDDKYSLVIDDGVFLDLVDQSRWINHSCDPNAELDMRECAGVPGVEVRLVATRRIAVGEEITYDYAFAAEYAEICRCGAASCRGWIVDPDEMHLLPVRLVARR